MLGFTATENAHAAGVLAVIAGAAYILIGITTHRRPWWWVLWGGVLAVAVYTYSVGAWRFPALPAAGGGN